MKTFKNADELFENMTPERHERVMAKAKAIQANINLIELRKKSGATQQQVADRLHVSQSNVAQIESRGDIQLSTLMQYLHAIGATLDAQAVLSDGTRVSLMVG
jgi:DNA-binding XRE family transcriptional regulator